MNNIRIERTTECPGINFLAVGLSYQQTGVGQTPKGLASKHLST